MDNLTRIDINIAVELLRRMKRIRLTEETIAERYSEWKMRCPTHLCTGQEAVAAAIGLVLRRDDFVVSSHRAHGHYLSKGGSLNKMIAEIYGKITGCSSGKGGSMHLIDQDVGIYYFANETTSLTAGSTAQSLSYYYRVLATTVSLVPAADSLLLLVAMVAVVFTVGVILILIIRYIWLRRNPSAGN